MNGTVTPFLTQMAKMIKPFLLAVVCLVVVSVRGVPAQEKPLKVFVLVGQSNMQGHADVKTLPYMGMDSTTHGILAEIQDELGQPRVIENVWISYLSSGGLKKGQLTTGFGANENKIGPELTFGVYMQKKLAEPILIIKAAWGGKSLNTDFRPPSAGPYEFDESVLRRWAEQGKDTAAARAAKQQATGVYYRQTLEHVKNVLENIQEIYPGYDKNTGYELAGLVWFQGWNDMVDGDSYPRREEVGGYDAYSSVLCHLIRDLRQQLSAPNLPIVIGVMGVGGPTDQYLPDEQRYQKTHQNFRDAMAAPADMQEFKGNVVAVLTENYWDRELSAILSRDEEIRSKINRFKKDGRLEELARQLERNTEPAQEDRQDLEEAGTLEQVLLERLRAEEFTDRELKILHLGSSNAAYHYLGCSKIMAEIGKAFAEAMPVPSGN